MKKVEDYPAKRATFFSLVIIGFWDVAFGLFFLAMLFAFMEESGFVGFFRDYWVGLVVCAVISGLLFWRTKYLFLSYQKFR